MSEVRKLKIEATGNLKFDSIYRKYDERVLRTAWKYTKRKDVAEEIAQNVFLQLYIKIDEIDVETAENWLLIVTRNETYNWFRKNAIELKLFESLEVKKCEPENESVEDKILKEERSRSSDELNREIFQDLRKTNERWYEAVTRVYCMKKTQRQAAAEMNVSIQVLNAMLYRARCWIKKKYQKRYIEVFDIEK